METLGEQGDIRLRLVAEEAGAPDPRPAGRRLLRRHHDGLAPVAGEIVAGVAVPRR
jgi:hypothetical protein